MSISPTLSLVSSEPPQPKPTQLTAEEGKDIAQWVRMQYESCKSSRTETQLQWGLNMVMFRGKQYHQWLANAGRFANPPAPPYRVRQTVNKIRPLIRNEMARLTSQKPSAVIVPASSDDDDLFAAQAGEQTWEYLYATKNLQAHHRRMTFWKQICGTAFIKVWWDDSKQCTNPDGTVVQGDIAFGHVTPFHLYVPDLREEDIENQPYIIHVFTRPVESLRAMWKDSFQTDPQPSTTATNDIISDQFMDTNTVERKPDSCLVMELWAKPGAHPKLPNGGMVTVVDNQVVQFVDTGLPYKHGEYPFVKFDHIPSGKFYADSSITDVIPLQKEYNRTRSQIIEAKNRTAKPKFLFVKGSLNPTKINTEAGQFIEYKPGFDRPTPLPPVELPSYIFTDMQQNIADFEDLTGQHQVSKGSAPPGVTAATAINYLQERDDAYLTHTYQSDEEGWQKLGRQALGLAVEFWDIPRLIKVTGTDGSFDALMLKGSDIESGTDIRIEGGSSLPTSKSAKQSFLMDLMTRELIPPDKGLELMEMGGINKLYDAIKVDERQAQRENLRMRELNDEQIQQHNMAAAPQQMAPVGLSMVPPLQPDGAVPADPSLPPAGPGGPPGPNSAGVDVNTGAPLQPTAVVPVNKWDNHAVHIEKHNMFRKSQAFELLPVSVKEQFELHVSQHEAMLVSQQMGGMQGAPNAGGSVPMPGGPPPESGGQNQFTSISPEAQA